MRMKADLTAQSRIVFLFVLSLVFLLCTMSSCGAKRPEQDEISWETLVNSLNKQRYQEVTEPLQNSIESIGVVGQEDVIDFTQEQIVSLTEPRSYQDKITLEQAKEDVDILFQILKTSYSAYEFWGGDEKFDAARKSIDERLQDAYSDGENITGYLHNILLEELSFVEDNHFKIGNKPVKFKEKTIYYDKQELDFKENEKGFYTIIDHEKWYLSEEDEKYLHLTLSETGELTYGLFQLAEEEKANITQCFTLSGEEETEKTLEVTWKEIASRSSENHMTVCDIQQQEGIPVVSLKRMSTASADAAATNEFINEALKLGDEKVFILDLRGNRGGLVQVNDCFLYNLTGSRCELKSQSVKRCSLLNLHVDQANRENLAEEKSGDGLANLDFYIEHQAMVDKWEQNKIDIRSLEIGETAVENTMPMWVTYPNYILVLIDKNTYSAGEYFLGQLENIENVVIMGTNSNGCLFSGDINAICPVYLPHSGLDISYGQTLLLTNRSQGFDTAGWMPDVILRHDALEQALMLAKKIQ